jgi:DNA-binding beta-propeller fold protein YncE
MVDGQQMPGGLPGPNQNVEGITGPETGLIVRQVPGTGTWEDEIGRDWSPALRIALPDDDVFVIDADADPPAKVDSYRGVGTILYSIAINPLTGDVYVANTEARNQVRFEPRVRGHQHESRITVLRDRDVLPRHLNKHLDYESATPSDVDREASLALPMGMAVSADGARLYVAAFGSSVVGVFNTAALVDDSFIPNRDDHIAVSGGGPSGLALDEEGSRRLARGGSGSALWALDADGDRRSGLSSAQ